MITATQIEQAEKLLRFRAEFGGMESVYSGAGIEPDVMGRYLEHHVRGTLARSVPNLDPRIEPSLNTLLAHFFMVGILCGRGEGIDN